MFLHIKNLSFPFRIKCFQVNGDEATLLKLYLQLLSSIMQRYSFANIKTNAAYCY